MTAQAIDYSVTPELRQEIGAWRQRALIAAVVGLGACAAGAFIDTDQALRSYVWAYMFIVGLSMGSLAWLMLQYLTGGAWGIMIRRPAEAATRVIPFVALLFIPIVLGIPRLYEWSRPEVIARDEVIRHKTPYLNMPFFLGRAAIYFAGWMLLAWLLNKRSADQDRTGRSSASYKMGAIAAPGLIFWAFSITFMSIDWVLSANPHWFSTIFGLLLIIGEGLSAMAFMIWLLVKLSARPPYSQVLTQRHLHDLGKFTLAFVMIWAYFSFSQFVIIWAGNLPEEIPWYIDRMRGGWGFFGVMVVVGHFALPFALLLSRDLKRNYKLLSGICLFILMMRFVDLFWVIAPDFRKNGFGLSWMDLAAPVGLTGLWLFLFFTQLMKRALLPMGDPDLEGAIQHGRE